MPEHRVPSAAWLVKRASHRLWAAAGAFWLLERRRSCWARPMPHHRIDDRASEK
jgi:hypothetical protein